MSLGSPPMLRAPLAGRRMARWAMAVLIGLSALITAGCSTTARLSAPVPAAVEDKRATGEAELQMAEAMLNEGRRAAATDRFRAVLRSDAPMLARAKAQHGLGRVHRAEGATDLAMIFFRRAVRSDPGHWRAWRAIGQVNDARGQHESARIAYRLATSAGGDQRVLLNDQGVSRLRAYRPEEALPFFEAALALSPDHAAARDNLRLAQASLRRYGPALAGAGLGEDPAMLSAIGYIAIVNRDYIVAQLLLRQYQRLSDQPDPKVGASLALLERIIHGKAAI